MRIGENRGTWQSCPCPTWLPDHRLNQLLRPFLDPAPAIMISLQLPPLGIGLLEPDVWSKSQRLHSWGELGQVISLSEPQFPHQNNGPVH